MDNFKGVLGVFAVISTGMLALAGLDLIIKGHLPMMQIAIGGGLLVLTISGLSEG